MQVLTTQILSDARYWNKTWWLCAAQALCKHVSWSSLWWLLRWDWSGSKRSLRECVLVQSRQSSQNEGSSYNNWKVPRVSCIILWIQDGPHSRQGMWVILWLYSSASRSLLDLQVGGHPGRTTWRVLQECHENRVAYMCRGKWVPGRRQNHVPPNLYQGELQIWAGVRAWC